MFQTILQELFFGSSMDISQIDRYIFQSIPVITDDELGIIFKYFANLRYSDENGIVVETVKYGDKRLREFLLSYMNYVIHHGDIDHSWNHIIFRILQKEGNLI